MADSFPQKWKVITDYNILKYKSNIQMLFLEFSGVTILKTFILDKKNS